MALSTIIILLMAAGGACVVAGILGGNRYDWDEAGWRSLFPTLVGFGAVALIGTPLVITAIGFSGAIIGLLN